MTDPPLDYIRRYIPSLGGIDIAPVILILIIYLFLGNIKAVIVH